MAASTPEQDEARRTDGEQPEGSRQVRRRLTFGVAGDLAGMPAALSPWQRAYEAWRSAGLAWGHGAPPHEEAARPPGDTAGEAKPAPAEGAKPRPEPTRSGKPKTAKPKTAKPKTAKPKGGRPEPGDVLVAGPPRPVPQPGPARRLRVRAAVVAGLVVVAGGVVFAVSRGEDAPGGPGIPGPVAADALFAPDPAATDDGLVQDLAAVASAGGTVVAAGAEGDGVPGHERTRFLLSTDAGRTWAVAKVTTADGAPPPPGDLPRLAAGGDGRWAALGRTPSGAAVAWTSPDARTWTRWPLTAGFTPSDQVNDLVRTGSGFVAVGGSGGRAVVWLSPDGHAWQRVEGPEGGAGLVRAAASGDVLLAHGSRTRKVTGRRGGRKVTRTVRTDGLWRSADGGRTWTGVSVPQAQGSHGALKGLAAGPGGFAAVREARRATGPRKRRRIQRYGVLFTSPDGRTWRAASRFDGSGVQRFGGTPSGLAVIVRGAKGAQAILRSGDGRTWQPGGGLPAPVRASGLTVASGRLAITGRQGNDAYLHGVDLKAVPGAVRPERTITSLAAGPGRSVAVGSTNGGIAIWTAPDGRAWTRASLTGVGGRLAGVVHGGKGWLAVGRLSGPVSGAASGPLAMTSQDGISWQRAPFPAGPPPVAAAAGPAGYVAVGTGAAWRSADLRAWTRAGLDGAPADVTAAPGKYVAVGGRGRAPAVWTSPDGAAWTPARLPSGLAAPLTGVAARGDAVVAIAANATVLVSTDAGATWARRDLPPGLAATAITATPYGFTVTASAKGDTAVLTSADGAVWKRTDIPGLTGPGEQVLTALTAVGPNVVATGTDDGAPILWRAPAPK